MLRFDSATTRIAITSVTVAGSLFIGSQSAAHAGGAMKDFKEFRQSNPGVDRGALRQLFKQNTTNPTGNQGNPSVPAPITILPVFPDRAPVTGPRNNNQLMGLRLSSANVASQDKTKNKTFQLGEGGIKIVGADGIDIDLTSDRKNISVGGKLFGDTTVQVNVGGQTKTVGAGSEVTAAEYVAAKQLLLTGSQTLELNESGAAVGGRLNLSDVASKNDKIRIDDLSIPGRVSAYGDFSRGTTFAIQGDLNNAGSIFTLVTSNNFKNASFEADSIVNATGATISSRVPIIGVEGAADGASRYEVNLNLRANDSIENQGTIQSSGDLTLSAGNSISNTNKLTAHRQLQLEAPNITNGGHVESYTRSVSLETPVPAALTVNNTGGTLQALNGAINVRGENYTGTFNTIVTGGDLLSKEVNVNAGRGEANLNVEQLTGVLNEKGNASHVVANTAVLALGNICLTGDPTYSNIGGDITLNGDITVGEALTIIAASTIISNTELTITAGDQTSGYPVTLIAGADITSGGTIGSLPATPPTGIQTTISGSASGAGGDIIFTKDAPVTIITRPTAKSGDLNGGDVFLAAYDVSGDGGVIRFNGGIRTGGLGNGNNGSVTIISGTTSVEANEVPSIDTTGGASGFDQVRLIGAQPTSSGGSITFLANGTLQAGSPTLIPSVTSSAASFELTGNILTNDSVTIQTPNGKIAWTSAASKATITTLRQGSSVTLVADRIDVGNSNFVSTETLNVVLQTGSVGEAGVTALQTDANNVSAIGSPTTSHIVIADSNPGLTYFSGNAFELNLGSTGTFVTPPGGGLTGTDVLIGSFKNSVGFSGLHPVDVAAQNLFVTAGKSGSVFLHNSFAGTSTLQDIQPMSAGKEFALRFDGDVDAAPGSVINAPNVRISTGGSFSTFEGTINGSSSVALSSSPDINANDIIGQINTPSLTVRSAIGSVGTLAVNDAFKVPDGVKALTTMAPSGNIIVNGPTVSKGFTLDGAATSGTFQYTGIGSTALTGSILAQTDIVIVTADGTLSSKNASVVSNTQITLQVTNATSKNKISLSDSTFQTNASPGAGDITIALGPITTVTGTPPVKGVDSSEIGSGTISWGQAGISGKGLNNVIAKNADVVFSNTLAAKNINLGGNLTIFADPPPLGSSPVDPTPVTLSFGSLITATAVPDQTGQRSLNPSLLGAQAPTMTLDSRVDSPSNGTLGSAVLNPSINTLQSTVNLLTAQNIVCSASESLENLIDMDEEESYSIGYDGTEYGGSICADSELYKSVTAGGTANLPHILLSDRVNGLRGRSLLLPNQDTLIGTEFGDMKIKAGAIVLFSAREDGIAIYNIHDNGKNSVSIDVAGKQLSLAPGRHISITRDKAADFAAINHVESISHRGLQSVSLNDEYIAYLSDFSLLSAMANVYSVKTVMKSQHPESRKLASKLIKTSAVLMHLSGAGNFKFFPKPRMTASLLTEQL